LHRECEQAGMLGSEGAEGQPDLLDALPMRADDFAVGHGVVVIDEVVFSCDAVSPGVYMGDEVVDGEKDNLELCFFKVDRAAEIEHLLFTICGEYRAVGALGKEIGP